MGKPWKPRTAEPIVPSVAIVPVPPSIPDNDLLDEDWDHVDPFDRLQLIWQTGSFIERLETE